MKQRLLIVAVALIMFATALAIAQTCPDFVDLDAGSSTKGGVPFWKTIPTDRVFTFVQFEANGADAPLSFWWCPTDSTFEKFKPKFGTTATDSTIVVKDGKTEFFFFSSPKPSLVYVGNNADHVLKAE